jgi:hypothetical protein
VRARDALRRLALTGALLAIACFPTPPVDTSAPPAPPPAAAEWSATLASVGTLVDAGRYAEADSALDAFATRHSGTPESAEARFWRALVHLDPANPDAEPRAALAAIDAYLAGGIEQPRYLEALVLRRTATELAGPRPAPPPVDSVAPPVPPEVDGLRAATDTIRQLRTELERTQAELERIRRRIRPGPPPIR